MLVIVARGAAPPRHVPANTSAETKEGTTATKATNNEWTNMAVQGARKERKIRGNAQPSERCGGGEHGGVGAVSIVNSKRGVSRD